MPVRVRVVSKPQYKRSVRVADQIRREVADILARQCKDPRLACVTVTDVEMNNDLRLARVYVSLVGQEVEAVLKILKSASGFVRSELGRRLDLRYTPEVTFWVDASGPRAEKIDRLLDEFLPGEAGSESETSADSKSWWKT